MGAPRWTLSAGFAAAACVAVLWITRPPGPGLDPDAMSYLGAAESFASRGTLRVPTGSWNDPDGSSPLSHFPAGFSLALAGPIALGVDPVQAARGVEALAAAATAGVMVWLGTVAAGPFAGALAGVLLLATPGLALDHLRVLSEPLFLALLAWTLLLMVRRPDRPLWYGMAAALATGVRYAGMALGGAAALWALSRPAPLRRRLWSAVLAGAPAALVQVAWTLRADVEASAVRTFGLKSDLGPTFREGWDTLSGWLAPGVGAPTLRSAVALVVITSLVALVAIAARRVGRFLAATGLLAACYVALVLFSRLFADEGIPLDDRLLSPLFLLAAVAVAVAVGSLWRERRRGAGPLATVVLAAWVGASAWRTAATVHGARDGGWGYASEDWIASDVVRWLRTEGKGFVIFSDDPADVWFATGSRSWTLPATADADSATAFGEVLRRRHGALIGFANPLEPMAAPSVLAARLSLPLLARFEGAVVWGPPARADGYEEAPPSGARRR
jgi:hypothetical protein